MATYCFLSNLQWFSATTNTSIWIDTSFFHLFQMSPISTSRRLRYTCTSQKMVNFNYNSSPCDFWYKKQFKNGVNCSLIAVLLLLPFEYKIFLYILWILYTNLQVHQPPGYKKAPYKIKFYIFLCHQTQLKYFWLQSSNIQYSALKIGINCLSMHACTFN
jgi:hypothetical protein